MPADLTIAQAVLLLAGWTVSFLLGRELQTGFEQIRKRNSPPPRT